MIICRTKFFSFTSLLSLFHFYFLGGWKCKEIVNILHRETNLPISIEHDFKFLVLLPLEASEKIEALKQYYGVTHQGQLVVRGIEIRRHDTPKFIKEFQSELLSTINFPVIDG